MWKLFVGQFLKNPITRRTLSIFHMTQNREKYLNLSLGPLETW